MLKFKGLTAGFNGILNLVIAFVGSFTHITSEFMTVFPKVSIQFFPDRQSSFDQTVR